MRMSRNATFRIRMEPDTLERFKRLARQLGVAPSTLGALAIGQFLAQQERNITVIDQVSKAVADSVTAATRGPVAQQLKLIMESKRRHDGKHKR